MLSNQKGQTTFQLTDKLKEKSPYYNLIFYKKIKQLTCFALDEQLDF